MAPTDAKRSSSFVALELAGDHVPGADVQLEPDELGPGDPRDDDEPQAATRRPGQPARRARQLVREVIVEDVADGGRDDAGCCVDAGVRAGRDPAWYAAKREHGRVVAEKLHAYTVPRDVENARVKDLADMVWLTQRHAFSSDALIEAATATFMRRASHAWPPLPAGPPAAWARRYTSLRKEMGLEPATAQAAHEVLAAFLEPVLEGTRGRQWDPSTGSWRS